jgi:hypothetical protein
VYFGESQDELSLPPTSAGFLLGLLLCPEGGSEMSDSACTLWHYNPEDCTLHIHHSEDMWSHVLVLWYCDWVINTVLISSLEHPHILRPILYLLFLLYDQ